MNSCNWVDLFRSGQFSSCAVNKPLELRVISYCLGLRLWLLGIWLRLGVVFRGKLGDQRLGYGLRTELVSK